jgi:hypothetical protein
MHCTLNQHCFPCPHFVLLYIFIAYFGSVVIPVDLKEKINTFENTNGYLYNNQNKKITKISLTPQDRLSRNYICHASRYRVAA